MKLFLTSAALLALCASVCASARADDWLAALPECAAQPGSALERVEAPAIEYPRAGLPAVVAAGQRLVARVQLPLPLTPPPGIQQSRALRGYSATLRARTPELEPATATASEELEHRYALEVIGVRPDGASSMRYRVTIHVPAWAAPGVYALELVAAGVTLPGAAPVVVLPQDAAPRPRPLEAESSTVDHDARLPEHARAPIDVWLRTDAAGAQAAADTHLGAPVLDTRGLVAALRIGDGLLVLGDCPGPHLPFVDEVRSVLGTERRSRLAAPAYVAPPGVLAADTSEAAPAELQLLAERSPDGGFVLRARTTRAVELAFVVRADGRPVRASSGVLELYPATELPPPGRTPALVARWRLPAGANAELGRAGAARAAPEVLVDLQPSPVRSGHLLRVSPRPLGGQGGVTPLLAVRFDERSTAFGRGEASHRYTALGPARVQALAILPDGAAVSRTPVVEVVTEAAVGCAASNPTRPAPGAGRGWAGLGLWAALRLLKRRPPRAAGNRLGARSRSSDHSRRPASQKARATDLEPEPS